MHIGDVCCRPEEVAITLLGSDGVQPLGKAEASDSRHRQKRLGARARGKVLGRKRSEKLLSLRMVAPFATALPNSDPLIMPVSISGFGEVLYLRQVAGREQQEGSASGVHCYLPTDTHMGNHSIFACI